MNTDDLREIETAASTPAWRHRKRTLGFMHLRFGVGAGLCGECAHFFDMPIDGAIGHAFKCRKFKVSSSVSTDWRKSWLACGLKEGGE